MSRSCRLPALLLLPLLLMLVASVQCQNGTTSLLSALIINKVERCIDRLNAIVDFVGLFGGV